MQNKLNLIAMITNKAIAEWINKLQQENEIRFGQSRAKNPILINSTNFNFKLKGVQGVGVTRYHRERTRRQRLKINVQMK